MFSLPFMPHDHPKLQVIELVPCGFLSKVDPVSSWMKTEARATLRAADWGTGTEARATLRAADWGSQTKQAPRSLWKPQDVLEF